MIKIDFSFSASAQEPDLEEIKDAGMMSCKVDFPDSILKDEIQRQAYGVAYDEVLTHLQEKCRDDLFNQLEEVIISISDLKVTDC